uniref:RING-type domain-containing protein n=1 Tax=Anopheles christyi TaxID=43041 RepID=A0A182JW50_9DIPT
MDSQHDKGTFLLCLAIFVHKLTIVLRWTQQYLKVASRACIQHAAGEVESPAITTAVAASATKASSAATTQKEPDSGDMREMAHALSLPAAPIDLPDNKQKDDDLACMSPEYFHIEENRLRTFSRWPVPFISPNVLARYGFYYVGTDDTVMCYFCRVEIGLWEPQDDVIQEHLRWSPYCPLLKKRPTNNVPLNANYLDAVPEPSFDICGISVRHNSYAENANDRARIDLDRVSGDSWSGASDISLSSSSSNHGAGAVAAPGEVEPMSGVSGIGAMGNSSSSSNGGGAGAVQQDQSSMSAADWNNGVLMSEHSMMRRPEYPNYAIEADRLKSYDDWPTSLKQKPKQLSDAGFFYTGMSDRVKCFSCGGGLKDWEQDDDPWQQHAIWYSNCHYLQLMKGREFIQKCNELKNAASSAASTSSAMSSGSSQPSTSGISSASSSIMSTSPASSSGFSSPTPLADEEHTLRCSDHSSGSDEGEDDAGNDRRVPSDGKICKICFVNEYNTAFMPCGHVVACAKCASSVSKCPLCQQPFINVLRLYLAEVKCVSIALDGNETLMETAAVGYNCNYVVDRSIQHAEPVQCLNKEIDRLQTFALWPVRFIDSRELARLGFFYLGHSDFVRCYFCLIEIGRWEEHDQVIHEHLKWSPHCRLMNGRPTDNVPIDPSFPALLGDIVPDVTGLGSTMEDTSAELVGVSDQYEPPASQDEPQWNQHTLQNDSAPSFNPKFPRYRAEKDRLVSFKEWPKSMTQTPERMADAGFYYTGKSDLVACFYCGGFLRDWLPENDPWVEHAMHFSGCLYLMLAKPAEFIGECVAKQMNELKLNQEGPGREINEDEERSVVSDENCCKICYNRPFATVFIPCGHVVACGKCAASVHKCPMCNQSYTSIQRIYIS